MTDSGAYSKMMTRKATSQELELKLKTALQELKELRQDHNQLLKEHEENEEEYLKIITNNTQLKSELAEVHAQLADVQFQGRQS